MMVSYDSYVNIKYEQPMLKNRKIRRDIESQLKDFFAENYRKCLPPTSSRSLMLEEVHSSGNTFIHIDTVLRKFARLFIFTQK